MPETSASISRVCGQQILPWLDQLAQLRVRIFRDFPYLYDGDLEYEQNYLKTYTRSANSLVVLALNGDQLVGASTGVPLNDAEPAFRKPFLEQGYKPDEVFYFGESVLEKSYRGQGIGHRFFDEREGFARELGFAITTFCAVERPDSHPARPTDYRPLDAFWQGRGYQPQPDMRSEFHWRDIGNQQETAKPMQFWLRQLA